MEAHTCQHCGETFGSKFRYHVQRHTEQYQPTEPYRCDECKLKFRNWDQQKWHMKEQHGGLNVNNNDPDSGHSSVDDFGDDGFGDDTIEWATMGGFLFFLLFLFLF